MAAYRLLAAPSSRDDVIATADLEIGVDGTTDRTVRVWSIPDQAQLAAVDTVLDFGGQRLALCAARDRLVVVAGAWERHGICGYDARTGERLWQRRDLKKVQGLTPARGDGVAAWFDTGSMQVLNLTDGATVASVRGVRGYWQSPYGAIGAAAILGHVGLVGDDDWRMRWRAPVEGFGLLAAAFSPDALLVSNTVDFDPNAVSTVYAFDLAGTLLWQRRTSPLTNVRWLGWDAEAGEWLGIRYHVEHREPEMLLRWSRDGDPLSRVALGLAGEYAILPSGGLLVTGQGQVLETNAAREVGRLRMPQPG